MCIRDSIEGEQIIFNERETTEKVSIKNGTLAQPGVISYNIGDIKSVFQSKDKVEATLASDFSADAVLFDHVLPGFSVSDELNITSSSNTATVNNRNFANTGMSFNDYLTFDISYNRLCPPSPDCINTEDEYWGQYDEECNEIGDFNGDSLINIQDIILIVNLILN